MAEFDIAGGLAEFLPCPLQALADGQSLQDQEDTQE